VVLLPQEAGGADNGHGRDRSTRYGSRGHGDHARERAVRRAFCRGHAGPGALERSNPRSPGAHGRADPHRRRTRDRSQGRRRLRLHRPAGGPDPDLARSRRRQRHGPLSRRQRNPRPNNVNELAAIKTLRYVIDNQEAYHRKNGRYGSLVDVFGRTPLDVPHNGDSFQRRGYRYSLEVTSDGFKISAMPVQPGPRPFMGDDSGIIRPGLE
jgi:hypothetical protein